MRSLPIARRALWRDHARRTPGHSDPARPSSGLTRMADPRTGAVRDRARPSHQMAREAYNRSRTAFPRAVQKGRAVTSGNVSIVGRAGFTPKRK